MNPILIVRAEIVCLIILLFILLYCGWYKMGKDQGNFRRICIFAIGHVVFDLITVLTVNHTDVVPPALNWICHIIFYIFALLYTYEFFCYIISICYPKNILKKVRYIGIIPILLYLIVVPYLPMEYLSGNGTKYSYGIAAFVGYGVAMLLFITSIVFVLKNRKNMDGHVIGALLPMLGAAIVAEITQIIVPEMLFTGGMVTIVTVGFFFSLENPIAVLRQKVLIDAMTGVKSRHSYEADIMEMERKFSAGTRYGIVFCDLNDLKSVNDTRGHMEGDAYIGCVAQIMTNCLKHAEKIYRMGGDEFLAVYQDKSTNLIQKEVASVEAACEEKSAQSDYPISVAIGYAMSDPTYRCLREVLRMADYQMYAHKAKFKQRNAYLLNDSEQLNISGLTDRIFDAFASTDSDRFLFVTNMSTNVTRWSHAAVEYFGMKSEFIYHWSEVLRARSPGRPRRLFR